MLCLYICDLENEKHDDFSNNGAAADEIVEEVIIIILWWNWLKFKLRI